MQPAPIKTHSLPCCGCHGANGSSREAGFSFVGFLRPWPTRGSSLNTGCFHLNRWCGQNSPAHQWRQLPLCGAGSWFWGLEECVLCFRVLFRCDPCRHHSRLSLIALAVSFPTLTSSLDDQPDKRKALTCHICSFL